MLIFNSISDIFKMHESGTWTREETPRGVRFSPCPSLGTGSLEYIGDYDSYFWTVANYSFHKDYVCRQIIEERYIEVGENHYPTGDTIVYYQKRDTPYPVEPGLNCFVNTLRLDLFSRLPADVPVHFVSLLLCEPFFERYRIELPPGFWQAAAAVLNPDVLYIPEVSSALRQAEAGLTLPPAALGPYLQAKAVEVVALLIAYVEAHRGKTPLPLAKDVVQKVALARGILAQHLARPPLVEELCRQVGLNKNQLQRGFRQCTGHSVGGYLRALRMEEGLRLLQTGAAPVEAVARQVGYHSAANFYKAFAQTFSATPGEMRKLLRAE